jgi:hypothetical protein
VRAIWDIPALPAYEFYTHRKDNIAKKSSRLNQQKMFCAVIRSCGEGAFNYSSSAFEALKTVNHSKPRHIDNNVNMHYM